jgi:hypothetical protein
MHTHYVSDVILFLLIVYYNTRYFFRLYQILFLLSSTVVFCVRSTGGGHIWEKLTKSTTYVCDLNYFTPVPDNINPVCMPAQDLYSLVCSQKLIHKIIWD